MRTAAEDHVSHQRSGDGSQQDAVAEMAGGDVQAVNPGLAY